MDKSELRRAWVSFLSEQKYSHAITLKPNNPRHDATDYYLRRNLDRFHRDLDRRLLGTRFADEKNGVRRTHMVAILEGLPFFGHIHAAAKIAPELQGRFEAMFQQGDRRNLWSRLVPGGTICVKPIFDHDGWHEYVTKRFPTTDTTDRFIFLPRTR